jgi:hypothetical protein
VQYIDGVQDESLIALSTMMLADFNTRWGTGTNGTVFTENETRGDYRRQKGLSKRVLLAAALDPRTKSFAGIPPEDQPLVWAYLLELLLADAVPPDDAGVPQVPAPPPQLPQDQPHNFFAGLAVAPAPPAEVHVQEHEQHAAIGAELDRYKAAHILAFFTAAGEHTNPLAWWREHCVAYPRVAAIARRVLCIPATSAPSERVFSQAGLTIANARAGLLHEHAADLVFLHGALEEAEAHADVF